MRRLRSRGNSLSKAYGYQAFAARSKIAKRNRAVINGNIIPFTLRFDVFLLQTDFSQIKRIFLNIDIKKCN